MTCDSEWWDWPQSYQNPPRQPNPSQKLAAIYDTHEHLSLSLVVTCTSSVADLTMIRNFPRLSRAVLAPHLVARRTLATSPIATSSAVSKSDIILSLDAQKVGSEIRRRGMASALSSNDRGGSMDRVSPTR